MILQDNSIKPLYYICPSINPLICGLDLLRPGSDFH